MAAIPVPETSFTLLLQADLKHALPYSHPEVIKALASYGAVFKNSRKDAPARLELLTSLMWMHAHQLDLHAIWSTASEEQTCYIAVVRHLACGQCHLGRYPPRLRVKFETPFTLSPRADSEHSCPCTDADAVVALYSYGAIFKQTKLELLWVDCGHPQLARVATAHIAP